jgi:hypothetical protein
MTTAQDGGKVVSLMHRPPLPQEIQLVLISVRGWVDPRAIVQPAALCHWKIPMTHRESNPRPVCLWRGALTTMPPRALQLEEWFVKFCHMICRRCFTSVAGDSNHDTYCLQNVKTRVGQKPLSYFVLATPYSFCSLNFCVTACQVKKRRKGRWHRKPHFAVVWYAVV